MLQGLFYIVDLLQRINHYLRHVGQKEWFTWMDVFMFYVYKTPKELMFPVLPISMLIAALFSVSRLSKNNELIAMMTNGVSYYRLMAPLIVLGFFFTGVNFFINEAVLGTTNLRWRKLQMKITRERISVDHYHFYFFGRDNTLYQVYRFFADESRLKDFVLIKRNDQMVLEWIVRSNRAFWRPDLKRWEIHHPHVYAYDPKGLLVKLKDNKYFEFVKTKLYDLKERPEDFKRDLKLPEQMNIYELVKFVNKMERFGEKTNTEKILLHQKIAFPFVNLIVMLIGMLLGSMSSKSVWIMSFLAAFATSSAYWIAVAVGKAMAQRGNLLFIPFPPFLGAWFANILFIGVFFFLLKINRK